MKVLVINSMAPYVWGGAEELAQHLVRNLRLRNIEAELLRLPFQWNPYTNIPAEIARFKLMKLPNVDRVISLKFPAYLVPSDRHTTWLVHQYRQAYDLWDTPYCNLPHNPDGESMREFIRAHDNEVFHNRSRTFTISDEVSRRLMQNNGVRAEPLRAPINDPGLFSGGASNGYILAPGRINSSKRQTLLVEAMQHLPKSARLIVAGPPDTEYDAQQLRDLVARLNLADQVRLDLRFLERAELANYVNHAAAVAYLPFAEDSYGYVTMEAFEAAKPVITCCDSGEVLDLVLDESTGFVCQANSQSLAGAMATLLYDPALAEEMGARGRDLWRSKDTNWESHILRLLGET